MPPLPLFERFRAALVLPWDMRLVKLRASFLSSSLLCSRWKTVCTMSSRLGADTVLAFASAITTTAHRHLCALNYNAKVLVRVRVSTVTRKVRTYGGSPGVQRSLEYSVPGAGPRGGWNRSRERSRAQI